MQTKTPLAEQLCGVFHWTASLCEPLQRQATNRVRIDVVGNITGAHYVSAAGRVCCSSSVPPSQQLEYREYNRRSVRYFTLTIKTIRTITMLMHSLTETDILQDKTVALDLTAAPAIKRMRRIYKRTKPVLDRSYLDYVADNARHTASILAKYGKVAPHSEFDELYPPEQY